MAISWIFKNIVAQENRITEQSLLINEQSPAIEILSELFCCGGDLCVSLAPSSASLRAIAYTCA
jgi:hypothetical protein